MGLSPEQQATLDDQGWVITEPLLGEDECDFLCQVLRGRGERPRSLASGPPLTVQTMLSMSQPLLGGYLADERLASIAADVLGDDVKIFWEQVITRKPGCLGELPWHQDAGYSTTLGDDILSVWLALTDANHNNGGLVMARGSHRDGLRRHEPCEPALRRVKADDMPDESTWEPVSLKKGQAIIFTPYTVHASFANASENERRGWIIHYAAANAVHAATGRSLDNRPWVVKDGHYPGEFIFDEQWTWQAPVADGWVPLSDEGELQKQTTPLR